MTPLTKLIRDHYGSQKQLAEHLGVAEHTIVRWMKHEPTYFLKHTFDMCPNGNSAKSQMKFVVELATAVSAQMKFIGLE